MRILIVSRNVPYPLLSGEKVRVFNLLKRLSARHQVTLLTPLIKSGDEALLRELKPICAEVYGVPSPSSRLPLSVHVAGLFSRAPYYSVVMPPPGLRAQLSALLARGGYDVVQVETLAAAHWVAPARGIAKVVDLFNVESVYLRRQMRFLRPGVRQLLMATDAVKLPGYERRLVPLFDRCLTVSEFDAGQLERVAPGARIAVIPNGVASDEFVPAPGQEEPFTLVFAGSFPYLPNADAALFFCRQVLPRIRRNVPSARVLLIGTAPPPDVAALRLLPGVDVTGAVPDVRPYLARAAVVIVPLRLGSGTRLKVLEAMAMGKAIVATTVAIEGLRVTPGDNIEIADTPQVFADRIVGLLRDPQRRARLGAQARCSVVSEYAWDAITARLEAVYREITPSRRPAAGRPTFVP